MTRTRKLTPKQLHFARCIASGMSQTDAYKEAYNSSNMKVQTIYEQASRLANDSMIAARVDSLVRLKEQAVVRSTVGLRSKVLTKLEGFMDTATVQDGNRIRATELLGKSIGLFKDVIEDNRDNDKTPEQLTALLEQKLAGLISPDAPNKDRTH